MQTKIRKLFYNTRKSGKTIRRVVIVGIVITLSVSISSSTYQKREEPKSYQEPKIIISLNSADDIVREEVNTAQQYLEQQKLQEETAKKKIEEEKKQTKLKQNSKYIASRGGMFKQELVKGEKMEIKSILWDVAEKNDVSPMLVYTVAMIETGTTLNPNIVGIETGHGKAIGLMQIMPAGLREQHVSNPYNPYENANAGAKMLKALYDMYKDMEVTDSNGCSVDPELLAGLGYNMGGYNLMRHIKHGVLKLNELPSETRNYYRLMRTYYYK